MHPSVLHLKCEHYGLHAPFLDLDIAVVDVIYEYKLYDNRDNYLPFIVCIPDVSANIPAYDFDVSILSEFFRIVK